ncbi:ABC transporter [Lachnoclostridium sp. An14]|uniref:metal ABC transporter ATP-binding protein n=1 Tax=Lachnoclostridium sp. An14 TaxID=1965562 RepID=UPI000B3747BB|nr:metal ABC transporter ATP-binding protein [Lachnoclostridium sp. An14]OUQ21486.1 ABC transporter [Lachnoclostridium sp. An14]
MKQPLIECSGAGFGYENFDVVTDVTMEILPGDYIGVVGENGAGKSTFIKGLLGLLKPTSGEIRMAEDLKKTGIGYLPQQTAAQKDFPATVWEVVLSGTLSRAGYRPFYSREEKRLAELNMERLGICDLRRKCYRDLSGGQKQRVLIARALCATERLLILDEPITGLDPSAAQEFYQVVRRLNREQGVAILMVSHDIQNMVLQAKKILHLKQKVLFYGSVEEYRKSPLGRQFLGGGEE